MISVVIATRNRAPQLEKCLRRFLDLDLDGISAWELIVVDNGSSDHTAQVVQSVRHETGLPLTYLLEPIPGVSPARNAGIRAARYDILAFTDDDCVVDSSWLSAVRRAFEEEPSLALVGGRVELHDPRDFEISVRRFGDAMKILTLDDLFDRLIGCNMAMSAEAIRKAGFFDTTMGAGASFRAGEDHEYFYRILKGGGKVLYDPRILIEHAHGRRDETEIQKLKSCYIEGRAALIAKHIRAGDRELIRKAYWEFRALLSPQACGKSSELVRDYRFVGVYTISLLRGLLRLG
jgi:glycosyltransferase involved in cell wall biosynthesis